MFSNIHHHYCCCCGFSSAADYLLKLMDLPNANRDCEKLKPHITLLTIPEVDAKLERMKALFLKCHQEISKSVSNEDIQLFSHIDSVKANTKGQYSQLLKRLLHCGEITDDKIRWFNEYFFYYTP